jgi:uncharacterized protein (TIGR00725 family)
LRRRQWLPHMGRRPLVGIFGSARIAPPDPRYDEAREVGDRLARAGCVVATGGYGGLMEAVSRGAAEAGGHVLGLPMRPWTGLEPNRWVSEARWADDIFERLRGFHACDALVALPGGLGTLSEATLVWANLGTDPDSTPPLLLLGPAWTELREHFRHLLIVEDRDLALVHLVPTPERLVLVLERVLASRPGIARRLG